MADATLPPLKEASDRFPGDCTCGWTGEALEWPPGSGTFICTQGLVPVPGYVPECGTCAYLSWPPSCLCCGFNRDGDCIWTNLRCNHYDIDNGTATLNCAAEVCEVTCNNGYVWDADLEDCVRDGGGDPGGGDGEGAGGLDFLRHPLTDQLLVVFVNQEGALQVHRYTDDETDTVAATITVDAGPDCHRPKWQCLADGIIRLLYQRDTSFYLAESRDIGRTWTVTTLPFTGDLVTYEWITRLAGRTLPVVMVYTESDKLWKVSVGQLDTDNATWTWSTPASLGVTAKKDLGRLQQRRDGVLEFLFRDGGGDLKIVRCDNLGVDGSGTWS